MSMEMHARSCANVATTVTPRANTGRAMRALPLAILERCDVFHRSICIALCHWHWTRYLSGGHPACELRSHLFV